jgi:hypothetical protein
MKTFVSFKVLEQSSLQEEEALQSYKPIMGKKHTHFAKHSTISFYLAHSSEFFSFWIKNEENFDEWPTKVMETDHVLVVMGAVRGRGLGGRRLRYAPK